MASVGSLNASLTLQSAQFISAMKQAATQSAATGKAIATAMDFAKGAMIGLAGAFSVDMFTQVIKGAADYADAIQDLSDRTGASTDTIQKWGYAAQLTGSSVESVRAGIEKFTKNLGEASNGNKAMYDTMTALGVTSTNVDTAMRQAADGISKLETPAQRNAAAIKLFGKSAGDLTNLLSGGSKAIDEWSAKAQELGLVISPELISNAGQINDKLDTMKMVLDAKMANMIVQNADAIGNLADNMLKAASAVLNFMNTNPATALGILGALGGATVGTLAGPVGTAAGAAIGWGVGHHIGAGMAASRDENDMSLDYRRSELDTARSNYRDAQNSTFGFGKDAAAQELNKQWAQYQKAVKLAANPQPTTKNNNTITAPTDPNAAAKAAQAAAKAQADAIAASKSFSDQLASGKMEALRLRNQIDPDIVSQSARERQINSITLDRQNSDVDDALASGKLGVGDIGKARADQLKAINQETYLLQADLINHKENQQIDRDKLDIARANLSNDNDIQQGALDLARTQSQRRSIMLKILDNQIEQERLEAEATLASKDATDAQKQIAQARLDSLDTVKAQSADRINLQTAGPLDTYFQGAIQSADEMNEALQSVAVDGLESVSDGFADAITGAKSFGDVVHSVIQSVIADLAKLAAKQAVSGIFKSVLGGLGGGLNLGSLSSGTSSALSSVNSSLSLGSIGLSGWRANGGYTDSGRYVVGENGPEIVDIGQPSNIMTTRQLRQMGASNDNNRAGINVTVNGVNDPAMIRRAAAETFLQLQPVSTAVTSDAMNKKSNYPRLR